MRWILLLLAVLSSTAALSASPRETGAQRALHDAERVSDEQLAARRQAASRAAAAADEATRLEAERVEAAAKLRQTEAATDHIATRMDALAQQRREAEERIQLRAEAMRPMLPLIERLSLYPTETLLAVPAPTDTALRGLLIVQNLSRRIKVETEALRRDQAAVDEALAGLRLEAPRLAEAMAAQKREADALDGHIEAAHRAQGKAEAQAIEAARQAAEAASRAESLRAALSAIETQLRTDEAKARLDEARAEQQKRVDGAQATRQRQVTATHPTDVSAIAPRIGPRRQLQSPVIGIVVTGWGEQTNGGPATGLSYRAPPGAHVVSPCSGRVVFADSFRSYGLLLIIDCGSKDYVVLSGFQRLSVKLGQILLAGEPAGVMPVWEPGGSTDRPALYMELRRDGTPVNPAPWMRSSG